jgi:hypothetical protein
MNASIVKIFTPLIFVFSFVMKGNAQYVYVTPSGTKYHLKSCKSVRNTCRQLSLSEAAYEGYSPCSICHPPRSVPYSQKKISRTTNGTQSSSQICKGITKSGKRCRNRTRIGNGYCFHHQP